VQARKLRVTRLVDASDGREHIWKVGDDGGAYRFEPVNAHAHLEAIIQSGVPPARAT
jgi:hypothetical protein